MTSPRLPITMTRPLFSQDFRVVGEVRVREHFQNDVHASVASRLQNFFLIPGFAMIEDSMRTLPLGQRRNASDQALPAMRFATVGPFACRSSFRDC